MLGGLLNNVLFICHLAILLSFTGLHREKLSEKNFTCFSVM